MRKTSLLGNLAKKAQNNATRGWKKAIYTAMWGETPKQKKTKKK